MPIVTGTNNSETIDGADGVTGSADVIFGLGGNDTIFGLGGDDEIKGGGGADTINGGAGFDTASYWDSSVGVTVSLISNSGTGGTAEGDTLTDIEHLTGSSYNDFLIGSNEGNNRLIGLEGNDTLMGGGGSDTLEGGVGNDTLKGGGDDDTLNGGSGIDTVDYLGSYGGVTINLALGTATGGDAEGDDLILIENLNGTAYKDVLWGNDVVNVLSGRDGNDHLRGFDGGDTLYGGDDQDSLYGDDGNDILIGGTGGDYMVGGGDNDTFYVDSDLDFIVDISAGTFDTVYTNVSYTLAFQADIELMQTTNEAGLSAINLTGSDSSQEIRGNAGNNVINGGFGGDTMVGLLGSDTYYVDNVGNSVIEAASQGTDKVLTSIDHMLGANVENLETTNANGTSDLLLTGNALANQITGNDGDNTLNGGGDVDTMTGHGGNDSYNVDKSADVVVEAVSDGDDTVYATADYVLSANIETLSLNVGTASSAIGNAQDNVIYGNAFDNFLNGGDGADQLSGLGGNDTFVFQAGQAQGDSVYEFEGNGAAAGDSLHFSGYGTLAAGATFVQQNATDWLITSADGLISETIILMGAPAVDASDFVFV